MPALSPLRRRADTPSWHRSPLYRWLRHPLVYWSVVALLVVITAIAGARQSDRQRQFEASYGELRQVPVAVTLIRPGEILDSQAVRWERRPAAGVPPGAATDLAEGAVAAAAIYPGEVVHTERVAGRGGGLSSRLAPGSAAVSIPTSYGVPPVQSGDQVTLIAVFDTFSAEPAPEARPVARHATVVEVDEDTVTVAVRQSELGATVSALVWGTVAIVAVGAAAG